MLEEPLDTKRMLQDKNLVKSLRYDSQFYKTGGVFRSRFRLIRSVKVSPPGTTSLYGKRVAHGTGPRLIFPPDAMLYRVLITIAATWRRGFWLQQSLQQNLFMAFLASAPVSDLSGA